MHVDGLRFDLASVLGRDRHGNVLVEPPVVEMISEDGVLADTKLIAEPWDAAGLYQVGQLPVRPALVGVERPLSRRRPPVLARRPGHDRRPWPPGSAAAPTCTSHGRQPAPLDQLHHLPRRLHAAGTSSPTTTSTTRPTARTTATARTTTSAGTAASRGRPTIPQVLAPAPPTGEEPDRDPVALAGRADAAGRRRVPAHPAGQQQRLVPGQRGQLGRLDAGRDERRLPALRPRADRAAAAATRPCGGGPSSTARPSGDQTPDIVWHGVEPCQPDFGSRAARSPSRSMAGSSTARRRSIVTSTSPSTPTGSRRPSGSRPHPRAAPGAGPSTRPGRRPTTRSGWTRAPRLPC